MSIKLMSQIFDSERYAQVSGTDLIILLCLADSANDEGYSWPSKRTLAKRARIDPRSVARSVARLEKAGFVKRIMRHKRGGQSSNGYWILTEGVTDESWGGDLPVMGGMTPESSRTINRTPKKKDGSPDGERSDDADLEILKRAIKKKAVPVDRNSLPGKVTVSWIKENAPESAAMMLLGICSGNPKQIDMEDYEALDRKIAIIGGKPLPSVNSLWSEYGEAFQNFLTGTLLPRIAARKYKPSFGAIVKELTVSPRGEGGVQEWYNSMDEPVPGTSSGFLNEDTEDDFNWGAI